MYIYLFTPYLAIFSNLKFNKLQYNIGVEGCPDPMNLRIPYYLLSDLSLTLKRKFYALTLFYKRVDSTKSNATGFQWSKPTELSRQPQHSHSHALHMLITNFVIFSG